jgi:CheY-like chemotaxis protein
MRRCLIVANQTLGSDELAAHLRSLAAAHDDLVADVIVPEPVPAYVAGDPMIGVLAPATEAEAYEEARAAAVARLQALVAWLRSIGVTASGSVGPSDPLLAIAAAERLGRYDDLVIATLPASASRWLRMDLPHRARRRFGDRVTVIVTAESGGPAASAGDAATPVRVLLLGGETDDPTGPRAALAKSSVRTEVTDALTAGEAVDRLAAPPAVDLVVLALPCPQLAVDVLVAALRATPAPRPPVAVVSPAEDAAMRDQAHEMGAAAVIVAGPSASDTARALDSVLLELVSLGRRPPAS